jgi:hypothetical protein
MNFLSGSCAGQIEQFSARRGDGMGPVIWALDSSDTARNLVEKVRRLNRAVERRDKTRR